MYSSRYDVDRQVLYRNGQGSKEGTYFQHVSKCGGTTMCSLAYINGLKVPGDDDFSRTSCKIDTCAPPSRPITTN